MQTNFVLLGAFFSNLKKKKKSDWPTQLFRNSTCHLTCLSANNFPFFQSLRKESPIQFGNTQPTNAVVVCPTKLALAPAFLVYTINH